MKTLFAGLFLETAGLIWDATEHLSGAAAGEGLIAPPHTAIFVGFAVSFIGAVLACRKMSRVPVQR